MTGPAVHKIVQITYDNTSDRKIPPEHFVIPAKDKGHIVYFPRKGICALVNKEFVKRINARDPVVRELFKLVARQPTVEMTEMNFGDGMILCLTTDCNLRCIYCYARGGDKPKYTTWPAAKAAINWALAQCKTKEFRLMFHGGGEPTLAFDMMQRCYEYALEKCRKRHIKLTAYTATNGTLSEKQIMWFAKVDMGVSLSFDGMPDFQNAHRPFRNSIVPSYPVVSRTIQLFNKYRIRYIVNVVVTKDMMPRLPDLIRNLHSLGVKNCAFSPASEWGRCSKSHVIQNNNRFVKLYAKCLAFAKRHGMNFDPAIPELLFSGRMYDKACPAAGFSIAVMPDGDITSCLPVGETADPASKIFFYGKIKGNKVEIDKKKLAYLRSRTVDRIPECKNCFAKYLCCGDCLLSAFRENGSIFKPSATKCLREKELYYKPFLQKLFTLPVTK